MWWRWCWLGNQKEIVNLIKNQSGGKAVGLSGKDGNLIQGKEAPLHPAPAGKKR